MATDSPKPLTPVELKELENAINCAVRSKDTSHELEDWRRVGYLFAAYAERVVAELKELREVLDQNEVLRSVLSRMVVAMESGTLEERRVALQEAADVAKSGSPRPTARDCTVS